MIPKRHSRFFLFINLALTFILVGMVISFFIFALERRQGFSSFLAYGSDEGKENPAYINDALNVQKAIRKIARDNMQAVVNISTESVVEVVNPFYQFFGDDFYRHFFGEKEGPKMRQKQQSLGSGFIIDEDGYLLSNLHVVKNATKIKIKLYDEEREYDAKIIGVDEHSDIALLKIQAHRKFPYVKFADSDTIEPGDFAIAIGNPYGLNNTMTLGIVSSKARSDVGANKYQRFIQVDVPINPGNSGGPLFNIKGEVIGINNMIFSTSGGNVGIGFAIPSNLAKHVVTQLRKDGKVTRGWLGVYPQNIDETLAKALTVDAYSGVYITEVVPDSPAKKAGLQEGDIITKVDGKKTTRANDLYNLIAVADVDKKITLEFIREGKKKSVSVRIGERPNDTVASSGEYDTPKAADSFFGMRVAEVNAQTARAFGLRPNEEGVVITGLENESSARASGLREGDIIKKIGETTIRSLEDYNEYISGKGITKKKHTMLIKRNRYMFVVTLEPKRS